MADDYDFDATGYPLNAWAMPGADAYGWRDAAGIPIDEREVRWAATGIMAGLHSQNFREHTAGETFKALDPFVSHAPQGFTLADLGAAVRRLNEIGAGRGSDAVAARFAGDQLFDVMKTLAPNNVAAGDAAGAQTSRDGLANAPSWSAAQMNPITPIAAAQAQGVTPRGDDAFRELLRPTPMTADPARGFRQDFPAAPVPTQGFTPAAASTLAAAPTQASFFDERFGGIPGPQQPNPSDWLPVLPYPATAAPPQDAFQAAATRTANAVMPPGGRQEGRFTRELEIGRVAGHAASYLETLARRAFEASEIHRRTGEYDPGPIVEAATLAGGALRVAPVARSMNPLANDSARIYNPPPRPLRPFAEDYPRAKWPDGAPADAAGRLAADIEGRPLTAEHVVGRRMVGRQDQAFPPAQLDPLTEALTGRVSEAWPPSQMGQDLGHTAINRYTGEPLLIRLRSDLAPADAVKVHAHEIGHVIDQIAGNISTKGLSAELKEIYNTLNNPNRTRGGLEAAPWSKPFRPESLGYKGEEVSREYVVEAVRAYMADPNYFKTVAPKTAAAIRAAVNANPRLQNTVQFNTVGGVSPVGGGLFGGTAPVGATDEP